MKMKRKIAESLNIRINLGNFSHIEVTKYGEEEIEFANNDERIEKEDSLRNDLLASIVRSLRAMPEQITQRDGTNKTAEQAKSETAKAIKEKMAEVQAAIKKVIPQWLSENPIPNIANVAKDREIRDEAKAKADKDGEKPAKSSDVFVESASQTAPSVVAVNDSIVIGEADTAKDLFADDPPPVSVASETTKETKTVTAPIETPFDGLDLFKDEDIF